MDQIWIRRRLWIIVNIASIANATANTESCLKCFAATSSMNTDVRWHVPLMFVTDGKTDSLDNLNLPETHSLIEVKLNKLLTSGFVPTYGNHEGIIPLLHLPWLTLYSAFVIWHEASEASRCLVDLLQHSLILIFHLINEAIRFPSHH